MRAEGRRFGAELEFERAGEDLAQLATAGRGRGRRSRRRSRSRIRIWAGSRGRSGVGVRNDEASSLVPLHVPHTSDRLDQGRGGLPVVPVLEVSSFEDVLAAPVAWVHVAHPPGRRQKESRRGSLLGTPQTGAGPWALWQGGILKILKNS